MAQSILYTATRILLQEPLSAYLLPIWMTQFNICRLLGQTAVTSSWAITGAVEWDFVVRIAILCQLKRLQRCETDLIWG